LLFGLLLLFASNAYSAEASLWQAQIVNRISEKTKVIGAVERLIADEMIEIDDQQIVSVLDRARRVVFFAVPFVAKGGDADGCFAQILAADFSLGPVLKLSSAPESGACDAVASIFLAKYAKTAKTYLCFILGYRRDQQEASFESAAWSFDAGKLDFHNEVEVAGIFRGVETAFDARRKLGDKPVKKTRKSKRR